MAELVRISSIIAAAAAMSVASTAGWAQPADRAIIISAPHNVNLEENQRSVQFRDLALDRQSGQSALLRRVGFAIDSLCENSVASSNPVGAMKCSNTAWNDVRPQLDRLFRR